MYVGDQIDLVREKTGNTQYTRDSTTGVSVEGLSDDLILTFFNDALKFLQSRIISAYPGVFVEENIQSCVANQEGYTISDNVFLNNKIVSVGYSNNSQLDGYYNLVPAGLHQRDTSRGTPYIYIRRSGELLINKIPTHANGKLRVNYYRAIDQLQTRRGQITSLAASTTIVLDDDSWLDSFSLDNASYISIVNNQGTVLDRNLVVSSYVSGTRTITVPTHTFVGVAGNYVVPGQYTSTHLQADAVDRMLDYCRLYAQARVYNTDSSMDELNEKQEVKDLLADIVDAYAELSEDIQDVPIVDDMLV